MDAPRPRGVCRAGPGAARGRVRRRGEPSARRAREAVRELEARSPQAAGDVRAAEDRTAYARRTIEELRGRVDGRPARRRGARALAKAERSSRDAAVGRGRGRRAGGAPRPSRTAVAAVEAELSLTRPKPSRAARPHDGAQAGRRSTLLGRISEARNEETERRTARSARREARLARLAEQRPSCEARRRAHRGRGARPPPLAVRMDAEAARAGRRSSTAEERARASARRPTPPSSAAPRLAEERAKKAARLRSSSASRPPTRASRAGARPVLAEVEAARPEADGPGGVLGLLADLDAALPRARTVLDRLLGHAAGAVVVKTTADALRWIDWLRARGGRPRALPLPRPRARRRRAAARRGGRRGRQARRSARSSPPRRRAPCSCPTSRPASRAWRARRRA